MSAKNIDKFEKGKRLYEEGNVTLSSSSPAKTYYNVSSDKNVYSVIFDARTGRFHCECRYFLPKPCSHEIAVRLMHDELYKGRRGKGSDTGLGR